MPNVQHTPAYEKAVNIYLVGLHVVLKELSDILSRKKCECSSDLWAVEDLHKVKVELRALHSVGTSIEQNIPRHKTCIVKYIFYDDHHLYFFATNVKCIEILTKTTLLAYHLEYTM